MSKRIHEDNDSQTSNEHSKKIKLPTEVPSSTPNNMKNLLDLPRDEFSHMITFLQIGEVIMLSLSCKLINNLLNEHIHTLHPYVLDSNQWSIASALRTHRRLMVNANSIDEVNEIFESLISKKEPISKLSNTFDVSFNLEFDTVFELFSKSVIGQPKESVKFLPLGTLNTDENDSPNFEELREELPISERSLEQIPIGFFVKSLIISSDTHSLSEVYKILSQFRCLESLTISMSEDIKNATEPIVEVPLFDSLRYLKLEISNTEHERKIAYDMVKLAPNLEYLDILYYYQTFSDDFLSFLSQKCPNLKGISIEGEPGERFDLEFTDEGIFQFLQAEPKLEYIIFGEYCCNISGEIFSKIGQFSNLRNINISRNNCMEDLKDQCEELTFGGLLPKLQTFSVGSKLSLEDSTQSEKDKFIKSFLEMAPNIKNIGSLASMPGLDIFDYLDDFCPLLTVFPTFEEEPTTEQLDKIKLWLEKTTILENIELSYIDNLDLSKMNPTPSVKTLDVYYNRKQNLRELSRIFPNLTTLKYGDESGEMEMIEILKEGKWAHLKRVIGISKNVLEIGPGRVWGNGVGLYDKSQLEDKTFKFFRKWIMDTVIQESHGKRI